MSTETRNCQNCKNDFVITEDDVSFYAKMNVPHPTFCPMCRAQRRLAFRNERALYKRKSDFPSVGNGKEIFSMYAPDSPVKVYERDVWLSDKWEPMDYGRDIDWSRPFLSQLYELMLEVPFKANNVIGGTGSDYSNNATDPKNCYLCFNATYPEDCMYSNGINHSRECVDCSHVSDTESSYESFWIGNCYRTHFSSQCVESSELWFCRDCQGCLNCFGSVNLRNKSYCFFNEQLSKEEYLKKVAEYKLNTRDGIEKAMKDSHDFWKKFPNKNHQGVKNVDSNGSYVSNSKNVKESFCIRGSENVKYSQYLQETPGVKDVYDFSVWGDGAELVYEATSCGSGVQNIKFALLNQENVHDTEYTINCTNGSSNLFGCVGLRKHEYCILNKQYDKQSFDKLRTRIKQHMIDMPYVDNKGIVYKYGEFFPAEMSPWAYNETIAQEYFPLTKQEALDKGYKWKDQDEKDYVPTMLAKDIPDNILEVSDSITSEIIECAHKTNCNHNCTKAFRIITDELSFYKKIGVPLPTLCPSCRTMERLKMRLGIALYDRSCMCAGTSDDTNQYKNLGAHTHEGSHCEEKFQTGFSPESGEIVYCEKCYQQEVI